MVLVVLVVPAVLEDQYRLVRLEDLADPEDQLIQSRLVVLVVPAVLEDLCYLVRPEDPEVPAVLVDLEVLEDLVDL